MSADFAIRSQPVPPAEVSSLFAKNSSASFTAWPLLVGLTVVQLVEGVDVFSGCGNRLVFLLPRDFVAVGYPGRPRVKHMSFLASMAGKKLPNLSVSVCVC
jgi:hypothetical protein